MLNFSSFIAGNQYILFKVDKSRGVSISALPEMMMEGTTEDLKTEMEGNQGCSWGRRYLFSTSSFPCYSNFIMNMYRIFIVKLVLVCKEDMKDTCGDSRAIVAACRN